MYGIMVCAFGYRSLGQFPRDIEIPQSTYEDVEPLVFVDASVFGAFEELVELRKKRPISAEEKSEQSARSFQIDTPLVFLAGEIERKPVNAVKGRRQIDDSEPHELFRIERKLQVLLYS